MQKFHRIEKREGSLFLTSRDPLAPGGGGAGSRWPQGSFRVLSVVDTHHLINFLVNLANLNVS